MKHLTTLMLLLPSVALALETLQCRSHGNLNLCSTPEDLTRVEIGIYLSNPDSNPCILNVTYGIHDRRSMWVDKYCWGYFVLNREPGTILHMPQCSETGAETGICHFRNTVKDAKLVYNWGGTCKYNLSYTAVKTSLETQQYCLGHFAVETTGLSAGPGDDTEDKIVTCESMNQATQKCATGGLILKHRILRKRSGYCTLGADYLAGKDSITVSKNCQADFLVTVRTTNRKNVLADRFISCASSYNRLTLCRADTQIVDAHVHYRYAGSCRLGVTFGFYGDVLWTRHDCRAQFILNRGAVHRCESPDKSKRAVCARGVAVDRVDLLQTRSNYLTEACIEGRTYGRPAFSNGTGMWVSGSCKADFWINRAANNELESLHCYSSNPNVNMYTVCFLSGAGKNVSLLQQYSSEKCELDRTFRLRNDQLLVSGSCNALFVVEVQRDLDRGLNNIELVCSSVNLYTECETGTNINNVKLLTTLSGTCTKNRSFGFRGTKLWVNHNCRARFMINEV